MKTWQDVMITLEKAHIKVNRVPTDPASVLILNSHGIIWECWINTGRRRERFIRTTDDLLNATGYTREEIEDCPK